jgi:hypothetical protein
MPTFFAFWSPFIITRLLFIPKPNAAQNICIFPLGALVWIAYILKALFAGIEE